MFAQGQKIVSVHYMAIYLLMKSCSNYSLNLCFLQPQCDNHQQHQHMQSINKNHAFDEMLWCIWVHKHCANVSTFGVSQTIYGMSFITNYN
jgi:hypothetical protein